MECENRTRDKNVASDKAAWSFMRACRKLTSSKTVYAGVLLFLVPSVICQSAWPNRLTYEQIYNSTHYAQIQPYTPVSYNPHSHSHSNRYRGNTNNRYSGETNNKHSGETIYKNSDETKANEVGEERDYLDEKRGKLLVGFARDPFRYSIPEEDYRNGVRSINPQSYRNEYRGKRGVFHLYNMLTCANGCDPLAYKGYGCYCGFLGEGRPTDGIDRCCQMHDKCYENIYCPFYTVYFQPYYWKCWDGEPLCALENYHTQGQLVNGCAGRLCECDRQFAMCVKRYSCPRGRALCRSSPLRLLQNILMFR